MEENVTGFGLKVNNTKLEYQGRAGKISRRGVDAKSGILSWNYQKGRSEGLSLRTCFVVQESVADDSEADQAGIKAWIDLASNSKEDHSFFYPILSIARDFLYTPEFS